MDKVAAAGLTLDAWLIALIAGKSADASSVFDDPVTHHRKAVEKQDAIKNVKSYKIVNTFRQSVRNMVGSSPDYVLQYRFGRGQDPNIGSFKSELQNNDDFIKHLIETVGADNISDNITTSQINDILMNDPSKKNKILDYITKGKFRDMPEYLKAGKKKEEEKDKDKPRRPPMPEGYEIQDVVGGGGGGGSKPIPAKVITNNEKSMWAPSYRFGGQDILKLTDTEKIEELKNWTLYDLVNDVLKGDPENLLQIQNQILQNRRFYNTYPNPIPNYDPMSAPVPRYVDNWKMPMIDTMPIPYPMRVDGPVANNYYNNWADQTRQHLDYRKDLENSVSNPDFSQIANSRRNGFTATDPDKMKHTPSSKLSLLEGVNPFDVKETDFWADR